jgi:hypothetical protein
VPLWARGVLLSARGAWLALACALALQVWGRGQRDLVVLVMAASGLAWVALACASVGIAALRVRSDWVRRAGSARNLHIEADGSAAPSGFSLPALRGLALVRVAIGWADAPEVECELRRRRGRLEEWLRARRRFERSGVRRRVSIEDALGLARIVLIHESRAQVSALPARGRAALAAQALASGECMPRSQFVSAEGDRLELRRHQPGDPARHIDWRAYARAGELFVRAPERAVSSGRRVAAYLICGTGDEAAAGSLRAALESGALGSQWRLAADGCRGAAGTLASALQLLARSGNSDGASCLETFSAQRTEPGERLVIFAAARPGPWIERVERAAAARAGETTFVIAAHAHAHGFDDLCARLRLRGEVIVVDDAGSR